MAPHTEGQITSKHSTLEISADNTWNYNDVATWMDISGSANSVEPSGGASMTGAAHSMGPYHLPLIGIGKREPIKDMARVLSRYVDGIMARTFEHGTVTGLAEHASVPVINALTDWSHPCQAMADVLTIKEHLGRIEGVKLAYVGDGNNVARSLAFASGKLGMKMIVATPAGYELDAETIDKANEMSAGSVVQTNDPKAAVSQADVIYTDTWVSMGQEDEKAKRVADFAGFQVDADLVKSAPDGVKIMHCLPAKRGYEITDEVTEMPGSIIYDQAENRMHFQRALLKKLMA